MYIILQTIGHDIWVILGLSLVIFLSENSSVRQRRPKSAKAEGGEASITFEVEELQSFATDFAAKGGFQKAVAFTYNHALIATGGSDGHLRVWQVRLIIF